MFADLKPGLAQCVLDQNQMLPTEAPRLQQPTVGVVPIRVGIKWATLVAHLQK